MAIDLEQIRRNYAEFDDSQIECIANNEAGSLEPAVVAILKEEIRKRGLDPNLCRGVDAQTRELTQSGFRELMAKITQLPCPQCGERGFPLVGAVIREVKSFVVFTAHKKFPLIVCPACADARRVNGMFVTATLGWWSPHGLFLTIPVLLASMFKNRERESDLILHDFVVRHLGEIETNSDKESALVDCLRRANNTF